MTRILVGLFLLSILLVDVPEVSSGSLFLTDLNHIASNNIGDYITGVAVSSQGGRKKRDVLEDEATLRSVTRKKRYIPCLLCDIVNNTPI